MHWSDLVGYFEGFGKVKDVVVLLRHQARYAATAVKRVFPNQTQAAGIRTRKATRPLRNRLNGTTATILRPVVRAKTAVKQQGRNWDAKAVPYVQANRRPDAFNTATKLKPQGAELLNGPFEKQKQFKQMLRTWTAPKPPHPPGPPGPKPTIKK